MSDFNHSTSPLTNLTRLGSQSTSPVSSSTSASNDVALSDEDDGEESNPDPAKARVDPSLPVIRLDQDLHVIVEQAMRALASDPLLFSKGDQLVRILTEGGPPRLVALGSAQLREVLSVRARWMRDDPVHPPCGVATALIKRGAWSHIRDLRAVTAFPVLSARGDLLTADGYDAGMRTLHLGGCAISVPEKPTLKEAKAGCALLLDLVSDFPFAGPAHKSALLAALLTPLSRFMHDGNAPLVVIQANMPGSGKSTLAQLIATIVNGGSAPVMACEKSEPNRKEIYRS